MEKGKRIGAKIMRGERWRGLIGKCEEEKKSKQENKKVEKRNYKNERKK